MSFLIETGYKPMHLYSNQEILFQICYTPHSKGLKAIERPEIADVCWAQNTITEFHVIFTPRKES